MKTLKYWILHILMDIGFLGVLFAWKELNHPNFGNVFIFIAWWAIGVRVIASFAVKESSRLDQLRPSGYSTYNAVAEALAVSAMAYYGMYWIAACYLVSSMLWEGTYRSLAKKEKADRSKRYATVEPFTEPAEVVFSVPYGGPEVHRIGHWIVQRGRGIAAISVSLITKGCTVYGVGAWDGADAEVMLEGPEGALSLTVVGFPQYKGWDVHSASIEGLTLSVCLVDRRIDV